jgi:polar amino acid transport system substrate-binding protein
LVGQELGAEIAFVPMPFPDLVAALAAGKVDVVMSGLSVTEERSERVLFTDPYLRVGQMALIRADDLGRTADGIDGEGVRVGVKKGTTGEGWAQANLSTAEVVSFDSIEEGTKALREDEVDYVVHDAPTVWRLTGRFETRDDSLAGIYRPLTEEYLAWAVQAGDADLAKRLNAALATLRKDGRLQEVLTRWIPVTKVAVTGDAPRPTAAPATAP